MASFGEQLRQAREAKQITLQEISAATKISRRALQALEDERFDLLPGGIFNKGFVRAYVRYVGLDENKMVGEYLVAAKLVPPEPAKMPSPSPNGPPRILPVATEGKEKRRRPPILSGPRLVSVLAVAVAVILGWLWWKEHRREQRERAPVAAAAAQATESSAPRMPAAATSRAAAPESPKPAGVSAPAQSSDKNSAPKNPASAETSNQNMPASGAAAATAKGGPGASPVHPAPVEITIQAKRKSWIEVRSDGKRVAAMILDPAKPDLGRRSFQAQKELKLLVGDPGGVAVTFNGKPAGSLGPVSHPARVVFTAEGMEIEKRPRQSPKNPQAAGPATDAAQGSNRPQGSAAQPATDAAQPAAQ